MSVQTQIERIKANIANAYAKAQEKGAALPAVQNSENLAAVIEAIPSGGTPEGLRTITVTAEPPEGGEVSGCGVVSDGITITLTADVAEGYNFSGWQENGKTISDDSSYTFTVTEDRMLTAVFSKVLTSRLPDGYTEVVYIQTLGGAAGIPTNVLPVINRTVIQSKFMLDDVLSGANSPNWFLGCKMSSGYCWIRAATGTSVERRFQSATGGTALYTVPDMLGNAFEVIVDYPNKKFSVFGKELSMGTVDIPSGKIFLFSGKEGGSYYSKLKCYYFKACEGNELIADFVPCIAPGELVGFYDIVGGVFYTDEKNAGNLVAGPPV